MIVIIPKSKVPKVIEYQINDDSIFCHFCITLSVRSPDVEYMNDKINRNVRTYIYRHNPLQFYHAKYDSLSTSDERFLQCLF